MANSHMLELISAAEFQKIEKISDILDRIEKQVKNINAIDLKNLNTPSQNRGGTSNNNGNTASANKLLAEQQRLLDRITDAKKAEAIENAKLRLELQKLTAENKKAAQESLNVLSSYQKLSAELNQLRGQAKSVAADMFLLEQAGEQNSDQYKELASTYDLLSRKVSTLHNGLNGIDRSLGDHRRNVGNYESGWNGLSNSINQLTREAPAFANSLQTGFMAISNNLPALADALNDITVQNARLRAEGQPTVSALRQITSALFSWQTALSLGVTLLTIYGAKIVDWALNIKDAKGQVDLLTEATERYQDTIVQTTTNSEKELTSIRRLLRVAQDTSKSQRERSAAADELIGKYPGYLDGLTKEEIKLGSLTKVNEKYNKAFRQLTTDIEKRVDIESKQEANRETLKRAAELEQEVQIRERINAQAQEYFEKYGEASTYAKNQVGELRKQVKARQELLKEDQEFISKFGTLGVATTGAVTGIGLYERSQITQLSLQAQALKKEVADRKKEIDDEFENTSLLDLKVSEQTKKLQYEQSVDFLASQYELNRLELEGRIAYNKEVLENEENSYNDREASAKEYSSLLMELAELDRSERIRVIEKTTDDEIKELRRRAKEGEITQENANSNIYALNKQREFNIRTASEQFSQEVIGYNKEVEQSYKDIYASLPELKRQNTELTNQVANLRQMALVLDQINGGTGSDGFTNLENQVRSIGEMESSQQIELLRGQKEEIQNEIDKIREKQKGIEGNEAIAKLYNKQLEIDRQILDVEVKRKKTIADTYEQMKKSTNEYFSQFSTGFINDMGLSSLGSMFDNVEYQIVNSLGEIETKSGSTFQKLYDQAQGTAAKMGVVFTQMSDIAQQAFNVLAENSRYNTEATLTEIDMQQRLAERFALTEEAKQQVQDQADEKRREARRKQAEQEKELAIFNAIIDTAQGVVAALSQGPTGIPLAALIGALGAAQIALISSREIPQFKDGVRNFGGGLAVVGDGGRSEVVRTPDGGLWRTPATDTLVNLPSGSDVFKSDMDFLRNSGTLLGGVPHIMGDRGLSKGDMLDVMRNALGGAATNVINIGKSGISAYTINASGKQTLFNDRVTFKSKTFN